MSHSHKFVFDQHVRQYILTSVTVTMSIKIFKKCFSKEGNKKTNFTALQEIKMTTEDDLVTLEVLRELAKSVSLLTNDITRKAKFNAQHNVAFEVIQTINTLPNTVCDCGHILSKDKIDRFHKRLTSHLLELTTQMDQIERKWMSARLYFGEERNQTIASILEKLKNIRRECEARWSPEAEPVLRTIAFLKKGKVLQQIEDVIEQEKYKNFQVDRENEKIGKDSFTYWQYNVLKLLK